MVENPRSCPLVRDTTPHPSGDHGGVTIKDEWLADWTRRFNAHGRGEPGDETRQSRLLVELIEHVVEDYSSWHARSAGIRADLVGEGHR